MPPVGSCVQFYVVVKCWTTQKVEVFFRYVKADVSGNRLMWHWYEALFLQQLLDTSDCFLSYCFCCRVFVSRKPYLYYSVFLVCWFLYILDVKYGVDVDVLSVCGLFNFHDL